MFDRVLQRIENFLGIIFFDNSAGRTDQTALAAKNTIRFFQRKVVRRCDHQMITAASKAQRLNALDIFAGANTASAFDAF